MQKIKWGIMGTGFIAERFSLALNALEDAELYAIGSRSVDTGRAFAERFGATKYFGSYEEMVQDPELDVVYIATPHRLHMENALLAIEHGKAVLCEKAFTVTAKEARRIADAAREKGVFVMEAYWPRFQPLNRLIHKMVVEDGAVGDIRMMNVEFVKVEDWPDEHRIYNPKLAGGTVLDLGIYTMSYTAYFMGAEPSELHAVGTIGKGGVDDQCSFVMKYPSGAISRQAAALQTFGDTRASILGKKGRIDIPTFYRATNATYTNYETGETRELVSEPFICNGYEYEAIEVMKCLREGRLQSDIMPLDESVRLMELLDDCRAQIGMIYPFE